MPVQNQRLSIRSGRANAESGKKDEQKIEHRCIYRPRRLIFCLDVRKVEILAGFYLPGACMNGQDC